MNIYTNVTGIGSSARERAAALIALAMARQQAKLGTMLARTASAGGITAAKPPSRGGK